VLAVVVRLRILADLRFVNAEQLIRAIHQSPARLAARTRNAGDGGKIRDEWVCGRRDGVHAFIVAREEAMGRKSSLATARVSNELDWRKCVRLPKTPASWLP
jgi:hypothetical protein